MTKSVIFRFDKRIDIPEGVAFQDSSIIQGGGDLLSQVIENMKKRIVTFQHEVIEPRTATPIEAGIDEDL